MAFLSRKELDSVGFNKLGREVKISDKASFYKPEQIEIGHHSRIDDFCVLSGKIILGRNVHIAPLCSVNGGESGVIFEDFTGLSYGSHVFSESDDYSGISLTGPTVPAKYNAKKKRGRVLIKKHSIIGASSIVLPGVTLGEGTSIGAMSLVTKSTESWSIYFGIPAKLFKKRRQDLLFLEEQYLKEWNSI
jgi:acetyltransferase-like isoleucine patch superfamily enzyme